VALIKHHSPVKVLSTPFHNLVQPSFALGTAGQTRVGAEKHAISQGHFLFVQGEGLVALDFHCSDVAQVAPGVEVQISVRGEPNVPAPIV